MWVLVIGPKVFLEREDGAAHVLADLGCHTEALDPWDSFDDERLSSRPPSVVVVEAIDRAEAARAALVRVRAVPGLVRVPALVALEPRQLPRCEPSDGFDDLILVPYVPAELYARIRRLEWRASEFHDHERVKVGEVMIDLAGHDVTVSGHRIDLTHQEFALLRFLATNRGRVFTRDQLLSKVWGVDYYGGSRTVDIHVRRLRAKLGDAIPLSTVRGVGYKMQLP